MAGRASRTVRIRRSGGTRSHPAAALNVPADIARVIPEGMVFRVEVTPDGVLYRALGVRDTETHVTVEVPAWAKNGGAS